MWPIFLKNEIEELKIKVNKMLAVSKVGKFGHKKRHHKWCPGPESNRYAR